MTMITPSYLGETIEYSSLHACRSTLEDPTGLGFSALDHCPSFDNVRIYIKIQTLRDAQRMAHPKANPRQFVRTFSEIQKIAGYCGYW